MAVVLLHRLFYCLLHILCAVSYLLALIALHHIVYMLFAVVVQVELWLPSVPELLAQQRSHARSMPSELKLPCAYLSLLIHAMYTASITAVCRLYRRLLEIDRRMHPGTKITSAGTGGGQSANTIWAWRGAVKQAMRAPTQAMNILENNMRKCARTVTAVILSS